MTLLLSLLACKSTVKSSTLPEVTITSPISDFHAIEGQEVEFIGTALDSNTPSTELGIVWTSSLDLELHTDGAAEDGTTSFLTSSLSAGTHEISLSATNSAQEVGSASISIVIATVADSPSIELLLPADLFIENGETSLFKVRALDPSYGPDELMLSFSSDISGEFCAPEVGSTNEGSCETTLPLGTHAMLFSVENTVGLRQNIEFEYSVLPSSQIDNDLDGYTEEEGDCNDTDSLISPSGVETINSIDDDCDGLIDDETDIYDDDGDGFSENDGDCDDQDSNSYPDGIELCDGLDQDCNGIIDNDTVCFDDDGDGFSENDGDCNDADPAFFPNNDEIVDGLDNNCNGQIDEGSEFFDDDGDCFCESTPCYGSIDPSCMALAEGDCDDADDSFAPDALEFCDEIDTNCNGELDDNPSDGLLYFQDADQDGYGDINVTLLSCSLPNGFVENPSDCDDEEPLAWTGADEYCDGVDNNCNSIVDEPNANDCTTYYVDGDGDGYGDPTAFLCQCASDAIFTVDNGDDCYDSNPQVNPNASYQTLERGDGSFDYDCDGIETLQYPNAKDCGFTGCDDGWTGYIPSCGQSEDFEDCSGFAWICSSDVTTYVQGCK